MSTDPRIAAMTDLSYRSIQLTERHASYLIEYADKADEAAGIRRVSLDAAIEAAAKAGHERIFGPGSWEQETAVSRARAVEAVKRTVTDAVMGGAQ